MGVIFAGHMGKPDNKNSNRDRLNEGKNKQTIKKKKFYKPVPKKKMPKRYEDVRFFEKRKIIRKVEQFEKKIAALTAEDDPNTTKLEELQKELEKWKRDLIYVKFYPKAEKYISLFPKGNAEESEELRQQMREKAEKICARIQERKEEQREANRKRLEARKKEEESDDGESEDKEDEEQD